MSEQIWSLVRRITDTGLCGHNRTYYLCYLSDRLVPGSDILPFSPRLKARRSLVLRWPGSFRSWADRILLVLLGGCGHVVVQQSVVRAVAVGVLARHSWSLWVLPCTGRVKLSGPLLFYDLIRTGRRGSFRRIRMLYVLFLAAWFAILWLGTLVTLLHHDEDFWDLFVSRSLPPATASRLAGEFLASFLAFQLGAAFLLTPAYVAGAVVEEKERQRLPFLLTTDLHNREIVISMLVSRVLKLLMVLLAGLPVLMIIQFLGGIDPELLLAGFAVTGLTVAGLAGLSMLVSVYARRPSEAIVATFLLALFYLGVTVLLTSLSVTVPEFARYPSTSDWVSPVTVADVADCLSAGNVGVGLWQLSEAYRTGARLDGVLPGLLESYAWFHGVFFLVCTAWAVARIRAVARRQWSSPGRRAACRLRERPTVPVGRWAMVWKEVTFECCVRAGLFIRAGTWLLIAATAAGIVGWFVIGTPWDEAKWAGLPERSLLACFCSRWPSAPRAASPASAPSRPSTRC